MVYLAWTYSHKPFYQACLEGGIKVTANWGKELSKDPSNYHKNQPIQITLFGAMVEFEHY